GGAVELKDHVPSADAPAVARLKAAGAIVFGKTNLPRWSGDLQSYNELFGTTNNPWDVTRGPGGSSGGPAAAVSCGLTSFELGTDIGGSVRIPSHFCGTFGLKPSYGVVPQRGYLDRVGGGVTDSDINVFGPMARSAGDLTQPRRRGGGRARRFTSVVVARPGRPRSGAAALGRLVRRRHRRAALSRDTDGRVPSQPRRRLVQPNDEGERRR